MIKNKKILRRNKIPTEFQATISLTEDTNGNYLKTTLKTKNIRVMETIFSETVEYGGAIIH